MNDPDTFDGFNGFQVVSTLGMSHLRRGSPSVGVLYTLNSMGLWWPVGEWHPHSMVGETRPTLSKPMTEWSHSCQASAQRGTKPFGSGPVMAGRGTPHFFRGNERGSGGESCRAELCAAASMPGYAFRRFRGAGP